MFYNITYTTHTRKIPASNGDLPESNDSLKTEDNSVKTEEVTKIENGDKKTENGMKELDTEIMRGRMKGRASRKVLSGLQEAPEVGVMCVSSPSLF